MLMRLLTLLAIAHAAPALAQCELSTAPKSSPLAGEKLALRGAIFQEMCKRHDGALVDGDDAEVQARLAPSGAKVRTDFEVTEDLHRRMLFAKAPVVLGYIVEPTGKVSWVAVLESSGDKQLDSAAMKIAGSTNWGKLTIDDKPVRLFRTVAMFEPATRK